MKFVITIRVGVKEKLLVGIRSSIVQYGNPVNLVIWENLGLWQASVAAAFKTR